MTNRRKVCKYLDRITYLAFRMRLYYHAQLLIPPLRVHGISGGIISSQLISNENTSSLPSSGTFTYSYISQL